MRQLFASSERNEIATGLRDYVLWTRSWESTRYLCAFVLLFAASLKSRALGEDSSTSDLFDSQFITIVIVVFESALATWLLSGVSSRWARLAALLAFAGFSATNLYAGVNGTSCGCFGHVHLGAWWMLVLDLGLTALLWWWLPTRRGDVRNIIVAACAVVLIVGVVNRSAAALQFLAAIVGRPGDRVVLVDTASWKGHPFKLFDFIDGGESLRKGRWTVVLYRHDCSRCHAAIAKQIETVDNDDRLALIEVPPFGAEHPSELAQVEHRHLDENVQWILRTPLTVRLQDGIVSALE